MGVTIGTVHEAVTLVTIGCGFFSDVETEYPDQSLLMSVCVGWGDRAFGIIWCKIIAADTIIMNRIPATSIALKR